MQGKAGTYTKGPDQSKHGPSWRDVAMIWKELEILVDGPVALRTIPVTTVGSLPAFQLRVVIKGAYLYQLGQSFTPGGHGGPTTMPAAMYLLLTRVYHLWESWTGDERVTFLEGSAEGWQ